MTSTEPISYEKVARTPYVFRQLIGLAVNDETVNVICNIGSVEIKK